MAKKKEEVRSRSIDPAANELLEYADAEGISTMFSRAEEIKACNIGAEGACCKVCFMGPCRFTGKDKEEKTGVCGATLATVAARNYIRSAAGGASAHADHGRGIAMALLAVARGETQDYQIKDPQKLRVVAGYFDIGTEGKEDRQLAEEVALAALHDFGRQDGYQTYVKRAPKKRQELWEKLGVTPRGFDREVVEAMHRTHAGTDQDADHIMDQAVRMCMADGWGGSMLGTDLSDILFGTPKPLTSEANLGVLKDDEVNIIIHGHEPVLSELIVDASQDPEMLEYAESKGAKGITLAGICCTANEIWMRRGVPPAGNSLHQELALLTGAVELMVADIQCVFQGLVEVAKNYHTHVVTTSPKAKIEGAAAIVGCNNARATQDEGILNLTKKFIENDVLVLVTGCAAHAAGKHGYLTPEMFENAGPGLSEVCETIGIPPVLHLGSCVDNSRVLTVLSEIVETGGLGEDIDEVPAVGISPEYYCEKALDIAVSYTHLTLP